MPGLLALIPILGDIISKVIPDPNQRMQMQIELAKLADAENERASKEAIAQSTTNTAEATNRSVFVAGWRPFVGWVCGGGLLYAVIISPVTGLPSPDLDILQTILLGMLGISASRTVEKIKGVTNDYLPILSNKKAEVPAPTPKKKILGGLWPF